MMRHAEARTPACHHVTSTFPSLSVVVPATNRPPTLAACLAAVREALSPSDELIVVDDTDLRNPSLIRNVGASRAGGGVLVFLDADVVLDRDALERFRTAFAADPELMAVFGSYDDRPPAGVVSSFRNLLHHNVHHEGAGEAETFWAGIGAIRRAPFLAVGGFDGERFPRPMLEDVELGMRMTDAGLRIRLIPEIQGRHLKRWGLWGMVKSDFRERGIPWTRLLIERRSFPNTLNLGWPHRLSALTVVGSVAATLGLRHPGPMLPGAALLVWLNRRFYGVLYRHGGPRLLLAGVGLHALHHLTAVTALPFGLAAHIRRGGATPRPRPIAVVVRLSPEADVPLPGVDEANPTPAD